MKSILNCDTTFVLKTSEDQTVGRVLIQEDNGSLPQRKLLMVWNLAFLTTSKGMKMKPRSKSKKV